MVEEFMLRKFMVEEFKVEEFMVEPFEPFHVPKGSHYNQQFVYFKPTF